MSSDTSSLSILVVVIAAMILVPFIFIGAVVLIALPAVRRRRRHWQTTAASLGLQSDPLCMYGHRGLPVRIFWTNEGQSTGEMNMEGAVLMGRYDVRGGRAGLRYTYCRALLEPPLRLGLSVARNSGAVTDSSSIRTGHSSFDNAFTLGAREGPQAQRLFLSTLADDLALAAQSGWQLSVTDWFVQIRIGGDYSSQFTERNPALLHAALDTVVHCGQRLLEARRSLPATVSEQSIIAGWKRCAPRVGLRLDHSQAMLSGTHGGMQAEVYPDCVGQQEWRTIFRLRLPRPVGFKLYLSRKGTADRVWPVRGKQVIEITQLADPIIEQAFDVCANMGNALLQALTPEARQELQRLSYRASDVVIEDDKFEASVPGVLTEPDQLQEILNTMAAMVSAMMPTVSR